MADDVSLQMFAGAAAEAFGAARVVAVLGFRAVVRLPPQPRLAVEAQYAGGAFQPHLAHRAARIRGDVIVEAVAVEEAGRTARELEHDVAGVLARDHRVHPAQPRVDRRDLAD